MSPKRKPLAATLALLTLCCLCLLWGNAALPEAERLLPRVLGALPQPVGGFLASHRAAVGAATHFLGYAYLGAVSGWLAACWKYFSRWRGCLFVAGLFAAGVDEALSALSGQEARALSVCLGFAGFAAAAGIVWAILARRAAPPKRPGNIIPFPRDAARYRP